VVIVIIAIELIVILKLLVEAIKIAMLLLLRMTVVQIVHKVIKVFIGFFLLLRNVN